MKYNLLIEDLSDKLIIEDSDGVKYPLSMIVDILNHLTDHLKIVLDELYCKDRKLEELGVDISCCDNNVREIDEDFIKRIAKEAQLLYIKKEDPYKANPKGVRK